MFTRIKKGNSAVCWGLSKLCENTANGSLSSEYVNSHSRREKKGSRKKHERLLKNAAVEFLHLKAKLHKQRGGETTSFTMVRD